MKKSFLLVCVALTVCAASVVAQSKGSLTNYYDSTIVNLNYDPWAGLTLTFQGQNYPLLFGLAPKMHTILSSYPETKNLVSSYATKNTAGNILLWSGLGMVLASGIYSVYSESTGGYQDLAHAVNTYDRLKISEY